MNVARKSPWMSCMSALVLLAWAPNVAAEYPAPKEGDWLIRDFRFHTGETLPELRLHYTTVGDRSGIPVLLLHATTGSGAGFFREDFAGELFGPPGRPWMRRATSSSFPMPSAQGNPPSLQMAYVRASLAIPTKMSSEHNTGY